MVKKKKQLAIWINFPNAKFEAVFTVQWKCVVYRFIRRDKRRNAAHEYLFGTVIYSISSPFSKHQISRFFDCRFSFIERNSGIDTVYLSTMTNIVTRNVSKLFMFLLYFAWKYYFLLLLWNFELNLEETNRNISWHGRKTFFLHSEADNIWKNYQKKSTKIVRKR